MSRPCGSADRLIVALDVPELRPTTTTARALRGLVRTVKIGSVLFTAYGPRTIQRLRAMGYRVMLDLKFFDIPSTVELSCRAAVRHRVSLLTVHASGPPEMLRAAVVGVREEARRLGITQPLVLGVTVLTSMGRTSTASVTATVTALAQKARSAGCDGVVVSAGEAAAIRRRFGTTLRIACPAIRPSGAAVGDQRRVATPAQALAAGADFLIVGRPITAARNPRAAAQQLLHEMEAVDGC